jgi:hypothetical protein
MQTAEQIQKMTSAEPENKIGYTVKPNEKQQEVINQLE